MWGKDDEIRELLKRALMEIDNVKERTEVDKYIERNLNLLIQEIEGMIFKEERILFPTSLEKLGIHDWVEILKETENIRYGFIQKPKETDLLIEELQKAVIEEP